MSPSQIVLTVNAVSTVVFLVFAGRVLRMKFSWPFYLWFLPAMAIMGFPYTFIMLGLALAGKLEEESWHEKSK